MAGPGLPILHFWVWAWPAPSFCFCIQPGVSLFFWPGLAFLPPRQGLETPTLPSFSLESGFFHRAWPSPFLFWPGLAFPILSFCVRAWPSPFPLLGLAFPSCPFWLGLAFLFLSLCIGPGPFPFPFGRPWPSSLQDAAWPSHPPSKAGPSIPFLDPAWELQFCLPFLSNLVWAWPFPFLLAGPALPILSFWVGAWRFPLHLLDLAFPSCPLLTGPGLPHPFAFASSLALPFPFLALSGLPHPFLMRPGLAFPFPSFAPGLSLLHFLAGPGLPVPFPLHRAWPSFSLLARPGLPILPPRRDLETPILPSFTLGSGLAPLPFMAGPHLSFLARGLAFSIFSFGGLPLLPFWPGPGFPLPFLLGCAEFPRLSLVWC